VNFVDFEGPIVMYLECDNDDDSDVKARGVIVEQI
jgi:hypothetical protein